MEIVCFHIENFNLDIDPVLFEEIYDLKENKWLHEETISYKTKFPDKMIPMTSKLEDLEILLKSMMLLINCQNQMPAKWLRFNEKRLREIIFAFVRLLSYTTIPEVFEI